MSATKVDVAIVGGGPAGLATAAAVRRVLPNATCHVFERARAMREVGASVGLGPNALNALNAINPVLLKGFKSRGALSERSDFYDLAASKLKFSKDHSDTMRNLREKYGHQNTFVSWFDMQQSLYEQLAPGSVSVHRNFLGYEEDAEGVWVHFEGQDDPVRAKLLVGADGAASAVRRACLGAAACEPEPTGEILYRALLPLPTMWAERFGAGTILYLGELDDRSIGLIPLSGNRMGMHAPAAKKTAKKALDAISASLGRHTSGSAAATDGPLKLVTQSTGQHLAGSEERLARWLDIFQGAPQWLKEIVQAHPERLSENAELRRPATGVQWGKGRVTLVGDAAHLIPPMHAQGSSQAFEDVLQFGHSVAALGLTTDALRAYEAARTPRIMALQQYERDNPREPLDPQMIEYLYGVKFDALVPEEKRSPVAA